MIKVAINGFGRIGRNTFKNIISNHPNIKVVAINDLTDPATLAHLLKYDSIYGIYNKPVKSGNNFLKVGNQEIKIFTEKDPAKLNWKKLAVDVVLECTGIFRDLNGAKKHLQAGAKRVILSAPSKDPDNIASFVLGVNDNEFDAKKDKIVDMASCTTNCLAPVVKVLNDNFKIVNGFMTTIHSYTNDQKILDLPHKDLRRARAAAVNIIPTTTGAAKAIGNIIPELKGKLNGMAMRVPIPTVSIIDLVCEVEKSTSLEEVNKTFQKAAQKKNFKNILAVEDELLVSSDYIGNSYSSIVDLASTMAQNNLVKVVAWYDNEWGYSTRLAEFTEFVGKKI